MRIKYQRPILVIGASGFLGSHVVERLMQRRYPVVAMYNSYPNDQLDSLRETYGDSFQFMTVNLRQPIDEKVFADQQFQALVHLASYLPSLKKMNLADQLMVVYQGVLGPTMQFLKAIRNRTDPLFLVSSVTVNGTTASGIFSEQSLCKPTDLYGVIKLAFEGICECLATAEGINLTTLRLTQLYGVGEPRGIILQRVFLPRAINNEKITIDRGELDEKDMLWVKDAADAFINAIESRVNGVFNISSGKAVTIREIVVVLRDYNEFP